MSSELDAWKPPFRADPFGVYIRDKEYHICFTYLGTDKQLLARIVNLLNGDGEPFRFVARDQKHIAVSDSLVKSEYPCLMVRGWGYLTGSGGLDLSAEQAAKVQEEFLEYCVARLRGK